MPKKSVVLASHEFAPFRGGVATYVQEVALESQRLGWPVTVWTVDYRGRKLEHGGDCKAFVKESWVETPVVRLSSNGRLTPGGVLGLAWGFWRRRREWRGQPVVLLSVGAQMAFFLLSLVGCRSSGGVTCLFHGSEVLRFQRNPWWCWLAKRFYRQKTGKFAVTTRYVECLLRGSGLLPEGAGIVLAPCALPSVFHVEQAVQSPMSKDQATEKESEPTLRVLTVARLHPRKGQREVASALASLPDELRRRVIYQMVGVGEEAYRRQIETVCCDGGVRCEFLGALDDRALGAIYARATVYAQASRTLPQSVEGFGITFLEAAAYGCPTAAWRSGGVSEAVLNGETGLLVEEGNTTELTEAVERLLCDATLRRKLGLNGREFASSFGWEESARVLCDPPDKTA